MNFLETRNTSVETWSQCTILRLLVPLWTLECTIQCTKWKDSNNVLWNTVHKKLKTMFETSLLRIKNGLRRDQQSKSITSMSWLELNPLDKCLLMRESIGKMLDALVRNLAIWKKKVNLISDKCLWLRWMARSSVKQMQSWTTLVVSSTCNQKTFNSSIREKRLLHTGVVMSSLTNSANFFKKKKRIDQLL